jgi:hypothetical protein
MANLEVTNQLQSDNVLKIGGVGARWFASNPASYGLFASADASGNGYFQTNGTLYMGRTGGVPTTTFLPAAIGTSNDLLTVTGQIQTKAGASVTPQTIATNKTITNVSNSPTVNNITNDTAYPTVSNAVYDVSIKGRVLLGSGTPDAGDEVDVVVNDGQNYPGMAWAYAQFPSSATGGPGLFDIRTRIISDAAIPSLTVGFTKTLAGVSTATYNGTVYSFNATRVA